MEQSRLAASPVYDGALDRLRKMQYFSKAIAIRPTGNSRDRCLRKSISVNLASKPINANQPVNKQYEFKGVSTLVDGLERKW